MRDRHSSGLRYLQFALRGVQLACTAIVLAIYSYSLATLSNRALTTPVYTRAVEGISGIATLYIVCVCVLLRCVVGVPLTSFVTIFFDFAFLCCFIYVAQANRGGAGSCQGTVNTPFGSGDADTYPKDAKGGFTSLPKLGQACKLLSACMGVSIIVIFFFIFSILVEVQLGRMRHRETRFGPGGLPPSKVEGGVANYGFAKWFHMYKGDDDLASVDRAQYGTVTEFDDGRPPSPEESAASRQQNPEGALPLVPVAPSQTSTSLPLPLHYDAAGGYQGHPPPPTAPSMGPLARQDTIGDHPSYQTPPLARAGTWRIQQPTQSFGPSLRSDTFQPSLIHRAGTMPLPAQMQGLQRMDSFRADSFARPIQRTMTENMSYMQSQRQDPYPYPNPGLQRTGSFPYSFRAPQSYQTPPALPSQAGTGPALYPDTRFLRPDMRAQAIGELPYPDDHSERIPFPGDRPPPAGQGRNHMYPNYQYADSIYERPR